MNRSRHRGVVLLATFLIASIGVMASPAAAAVTSVGPNLTTAQNTSVSGTVTFTPDAGETLYYNWPAPNPANGTVVYDLVTGGGRFNTTVVINYTYTPDTGFAGTDSAQFGVLATPVNTQHHHTVTFTVVAPNIAPVANDGAETVAEDHVLTSALTGSDTDPLTFTVDSEPSNGTVDVDPDGSYTYAADLDFNGTDSFDFEVCDTAGLCDTGTLTINVTAVNDAPVATDGSVSSDEDTVIPGFVTATDADDDALTYTVVTDPADGTVVLDSDGTYDHTPDEHFNGTDSFDFEVCDTADLCDTGTLTINVTAINDAPASADDAVTTGEDSPADGITPVTDVDDAEHTFTVAVAPANGTLTLDADTGAWTYAPGADHHGADSFTIRVCDAGDLCDTSTVSVTVAARNDAPVATDAAVTTAEDATADGTVAVADTDDTTFAFHVSAPAAHGTAAVDATTGAWTYAPASDFHGADSFTTRVCDPGGLCDTAVLNVTITSVNDAPDAEAASDAGADETVTVGTPVTLRGEDGTDVDGDVLTGTWTRTGGPVVALTVGGTVTFTPTEAGTYTFRLEVCDPDGMCDTDDVEVLVLAAQAAPPSLTQAPGSPDPNVELVRTGSGAASTAAAAALMIAIGFAITSTTKRGRRS